MSIGRVAASGSSKCGFEEGYPLKILHICQRDDPNTGGALRVAEALVREQRRAGLDAWILFLYGPPGRLYNEFAPNAVCFELFSSRQALQGIRALRREVQRISPDLVHSHDGIHWPRLTYLFRSVPVVTHAHAPPGPMILLKDRVGWLLNKMTTDWLIGISQHTIDSWRVLGFPFGKISHIPNGVDFDRFAIPDVSIKAGLRNQLGLPIGKRFIVWVGRLHRKVKGTDRIEKVATALPDGTALLVVGDGPEYVGMQERNQEIIKAGRLILIGSTSDPEKYYRAADAFLFTSYHEPFGLVILEAVASGLPILAFPVSGGGGGAELLKEFEATMLDDDATPELIAEMLNTVFARCSDSERIRLQAEQRYAWSPISALMVEVYKEVLAKWRACR
ncbi:MAG: glycosyltransferase family 4 protein [Desulfobulbus sp.]|nr:glycosyltransferase family 4 protein [Desulfobulbus sp.]